MRAPRKVGPLVGRVKERPLEAPLPKEPWVPPAYDDKDIAALQALRRGDATAEQQQRALAWVLYACGTTQWGYVPGDQSARDVWAGRQFVGHQIAKVLKTSLKTEEAREERGS